MKLQEKHESKAHLKDGRELDGFFYWIHEGERKWSVGFKPIKNQADGTIWLHEEAVKDEAKLPEGFNVYRPEMLHSASFALLDPATAGLEPAMTKILLGMMYQFHNRKVTRLKGFHPMRDVIHGRESAQISYNWLKTINDLESRYSFRVNDRSHTIWGGSVDAATFRGGVSLFGYAIVEITITPFGQLMDERVAHIPTGRTKQSSAPY